MNNFIFICLAIVLDGLLIMEKMFSFVRQKDDFKRYKVLGQCGPSQEELVSLSHLMINYQRFHHEQNLLEIRSWSRILWCSHPWLSQLNIRCLNPLEALLGTDNF